MTPPTDRERLDAIRQRLAEMFYGIVAPAEDVEWLLDRLAALEHEREALLKAFEVETVQEAIEEHQLRDTYWQPFQTRDEINMGMRRIADAIQAALLPDPAGTSPQQKDNKDNELARAHGDAQASIDRIYRVQQNGEQ